MKNRGHQAIVFLFDSSHETTVHQKGLLQHCLQMPQNNHQVTLLLSGIIRAIMLLQVGQACVKSTQSTKQLGAFVLKVHCIIHIWSEMHQIHPSSFEEGSKYSCFPKPHLKQNRNAIKTDWMTQQRLVPCLEIIWKILYKVKQN